MISLELFEQTKFEEGLRLETYLCPAGKRTIGYGHNLDANPRFENNIIPDAISQDVAEAILYDDLRHTETLLAAAWHGLGLLGGARRDACIQMAFQLGLDGFLGFKKMRAALMLCDWRQAYLHAKDSKWYDQCPNRAERVAGQFLTGKYYEVPEHDMAA